MTELSGADSIASISNVPELRPLDVAVGDADALEAADRLGAELDADRVRADHALRDRHVLARP